MAKRRKRRSSAVLTERAMKDIRNLHREHLKEISAILTNVLGFPVKVSPVRATEVLRLPRKKKGGKVTRRVAHVAGYQEEPPPDHEAASGAAVHEDPVGF
jgi:hypothetical protein